MRKKYKKKTKEGMNATATKVSICIKLPIKKRTNKSHNTNDPRQHQKNYQKGNP
jgi:hypothetical protein